MIRRPVSVALVLALSGCGFHLRSALDLPADLGPVRVAAADRYSPLADSLSQSLARVGAQRADKGQLDVAVLDVLSERWGDAPVSIDQFGRSVEFTLRYAVVFELRGADGAVVVPRQTIELARDYVSNPTQSIGTEGEREILMRELRREMVASILRRIDAVTQSGTPAPPPMPSR